MEEVIRMVGHVRGLDLVWTAAAWLVAFQIACWLVAVAQRKALVCWSVGPLGVSAVYLQQPSAGLLAAQVGVPALAVAGATYVGLYVVSPPPIAGLDLRPVAEAATSAVAAVAAMGVQVLRLVWDLRFPLWGEARVLACVQRSRALGALVHFTPAGRDFLRERFGATPREFLRTVG
jgi:hypothetical protein